MGQTKKRRQTKHRGNAAGMIESRGSTGSRTPVAGQRDASGVRVPPKPSWQRAVLKALLPLVLLAPFLFLTQKNTTVAAKFFFLVVAFAIYIPMSYYIDRWAYNRYLKQRSG
ncbi:MAG: hypothetical protein QM679_11610 [Patulibacter sp.]